MVSRAGKQFSLDGLSFNVDLEEIFTFIGAADGMLSDVASKSSEYLDAVVDEAFRVEDEKFNVLAAGIAKTGAISHMYEWGTLGINKGRSNVRPNPTSPNARLWETYTEGAGLSRMVWYAFKPSVGIVPKPTSRDTGMDPAVIRKMRDHRFVWKAKVFEEGTRVEIKPKQAKFLLIPVTDKNRHLVRTNDASRGYTLSGATSAVPGATKKGNFTKLWMSYWLEIANVEKQVADHIVEDWEPEMIKRRTTRTVRPLGTINVKAEIAKKKKAAQRAALTKAKARSMAK